MRLRLPERGRGPVDGLFTPTALLALALLLLNDHVLKGRAPGLVTGKLSDLAGLVFFPLLLQAAVEFFLAGLGVWRGPSNRVLLGAVLATGAVFSAVQLWPPATDLYSWSLGAFQWPPRALAALLFGDEPVAFAPARSWPDLSDLLALPALGLAWRAARLRGPAAPDPRPRAGPG